MNPLRISNTGWEDGLYKVTDVKGGTDGSAIVVTIDLGQRTIEWSNATLGYLPRLISEPRKGLDAIFLVFENDVDAMLFKVNFAQYWQEPSDDD